jgi:hypothetical protein
MGYLDGTFGGTILSNVDFGQMDEIDQDGNITTIKIPLYEIIKNALVQYAHELPHKIIIEDL